MKAIGMYIFGGSQTIGWMQAGFSVDTVLEMTDEMKENNAYHFCRNYSDINVVLPKDWQTEGYLDALVDKYDVMFANPPCSGLSRINQWAKADNAVNGHIYEVVEVASKIKPKVLFIENAPTLSTYGLPILKDIYKTMKDSYRMCVINDVASNHSVAMKRRRTFVIFFRRDVFSNMPIVDQHKDAVFTVTDALKGLGDETPNMEFDKGVFALELQPFYKYVQVGDTILHTIYERFDEVKDQLSDFMLHVNQKYKDRKDVKEGVWDKSAKRVNKDGCAPSMGSFSQFIHPTEDRDFYVREYARLMGYPDDFEFYNDCKCRSLACISQGVPVNFIKYIANEVSKAFNKSLERHTNADVLYINQTSGKQLMTPFNDDEFADCITITQKAIKEVSLFS